MRYIVLDMEWNMPERKHLLVTDPIPLYGEITQIGAVMLDEEMNEIGEFNIEVIPKFYKKMNRKVEELTGITYKELIENGVPFPEAITKFREWCGDDSVIFTWGPSDIDMMVDNLIMYDMDYDWIPEDFDAQIMFDDQETQEGRSFSLDYAVYYFRVKGIKAHDALNDARDTAGVMRHLDVPTFIREEREWRAECDAEEEEEE